MINEDEASGVDSELLISIIKRDADSWFYNFRGDDYYLFESRDNTLINSLEKIRNIAEFEDINILTEVLSNSLTRRTPPKGRSYPPEEVIKKYLLSSKYTNTTGDVVSIIAERDNLTEVESAVAEYMKTNKVIDYPTISSHLKSLGYEKPLIDKTVFKSPLIHVDKSEGRYHYKFQLVGSLDAQLPEKPSVYEEFRQRLLTGC